MTAFQLLPEPFTLLDQDEDSGGTPGPAGISADDLVTSWPYELLPSVSAWSINTFRTCPEQFRRTVILRERQPPRAARVKGTAGHDAHEHNFRQKIGSHEDLPLVEVVEFLNDQAWPNAVERDGGLTEIDWADEAERQLKSVPKAKAAKQKIADGARDTIAELVGMYHEAASPLIQPTSCEEWFEVDVGLPVVLKGRIDMKAEVPVLMEVKEAATWVEDDLLREPRIVDHKFRGSEGQKNTDRFQGRIYQLADPVVFENHLSVMPKPRKGAKTIPASKVVAFDDRYRIAPPEPWEALRTVASIRSTMVMIAHLANTLGPDERWPDAMTHDWACGYCGFGPNGSAQCGWWKP